MTAPSRDSISLYLHIPFCRKKCDYCDFFSLGKNTCPESERLKADYVSALIREVTFYARQYGIAAWKTVYIGGGTPSQLAPAQLERLLAGIFSVVPPAPAAEITLEVNPDDVTEAGIAAYARAGVNRISMGVQAFDQGALDAVHRGASAASALRALSLLQKRWRGHLSCDVIAGLPHHTYASFLDGIRTLTSFSRVDHLSLYTLTVETGTPLAQKISRGELAWSAEKADRMWIRGRNLLESCGFAQYEVSNFSKPGCESRHNTAYWRQQDYLGCGAGATGTVYGRFGGADTTPAVPTQNAQTERGVRWTNTTDVAAYNRFWLSCGEPGRAAVLPDTLPRETEVLDKATQEFEYLMTGFRLLEGIAAADYRARFGTSLAERIGASDGVFFSWQKKRLATIRNADNTPDLFRYALTRRGLLLLNRFLEKLW